MIEIKDIYQLDQCLEWIVINNYKKVVIQLNFEDLKHSVAITNYLREKHNDQFEQKHSTHPSNDDPYQPLDLYVSQSSTCCVDLIVTQHVSNLDAIIHMGRVCLSKPSIKNQRSELPILFAFGKQPITEEKLSYNIEFICKQIEFLKSSDPYCKICLLYDTSLVEYAHKLEMATLDRCFDSFVDIANLNCISDSWYTLPEHESKFIRRDQAGSLHEYGQYLLSMPIDSYNCAIHLGDRKSIQLSLEGPSKMIKVDCYKDPISIENLDVTRLLNKRMALVGRLKDEEELKIGVIITNPLPDITSAMQRLESYAKPRKHTLYFISMIQTIDECKIGNFDLCDAFIVINSCTCSTILESLVFNRPIITELEFKLACGFEAEYGRVMWPGSSSHLSEDDMINKRKVSDVTVALVHMRNELLERCSQARANKWSGLEYKASSDASTGESLAVEEGLKGIASSYSSEPLKREKDLVESKCGDDCGKGDDGSPEIGGG